MSKLAKLMVLAALIVAVVLPLGASAQGPTTISLWFHAGQGGERETLNAQIEAFNAAQSEYMIEAVQLPEGSYTDQVKAASAAGDLPCVLDFDGPNLYNFAWSGDLIPIDDYVSEDLLADILPSIIEQGTYNGRLYSLGTFDSGMGIWGNRAMLEEAGVRIPTSIDDAWTLDELNATLEALEGVIAEDSYVIDLKMNYGGEWFSYGFAPIIQSFGGDLIDRETYSTAEGFLNGPEAVAAGEWIQSLFTEGYAIVEPVDPDADFAEGRVPLSWVGHWMYPVYKEALGDNLVLILMPKFGEKAVTGMGSWNWGITSSCETPDGAWAFIEYILQPAEVERMAAASGAVPSRISVLEDDERYAEGGDLHIYFQQLTQGVAVPRPATPAYPTISSAMETAIRDIANGADVQATLDAAVDKIDADIEANNGYPISE
jgi:multiple sugar transport system substrate-binding protein